MVESECEHFAIRLLLFSEVSDFKANCHLVAILVTRRICCGEHSSTFIEQTVCEVKNAIVAFVFVVDLFEAEAEIVFCCCF